MYPILTYSRKKGDFSIDLKALCSQGLKAIRLIYKGLSEQMFSERIQEIQHYIEDHGLDLDIIVDLPGKKPIVGNLDAPITVERGAEYLIHEQAGQSMDQGIPTENFFGHECLPSLSPGDILSFADDELNMLIKEVRGQKLVCEALNSFELSSNRSFSIKNKPLPVAANAARDVDFVRNLKTVSPNLKLLVSFTRSKDDILLLRTLKPHVEIIPKIETPIEASVLIGILDNCTSVMLGRGDLSLTCPPDQLFSFQKQLIDLCRERKKHLIIGTGLLNGIGEKGAPSIAEIMDFGYLRDMEIEGFLIAGPVAQKQPLKVLEFMSNFGHPIVEKIS